MPSSNMIDEIIDVHNISYADDENWLYESPVKNSNVNDLKEWLYQDTTALKDYDFHSNRLLLIRELARIDTKKNIDSRTFTRPKKRFSRPSIENYDGYLKTDKIESDSSLIDENHTTKIYKDCPSDINVCDNPPVAQQSPLNFDFSQPTTSSIFEKIIATASGDDSFQNMSPPSLINSMCSSMFTNLMENSMIKNDPLLREISVTDYTEAMLQDYDPPLFKSLTDSCSSINLDNPESFIKQHSDSTLNKVYKKNVSGCSDLPINETYMANTSDSPILQDTYVKDRSIDSSFTNSCNDTIILAPVKNVNKISPNLNGTYKKSINSKLNETFEKMPLYHSNDNLNSTITYSNDTNKSNDSKRHSYIVDTYNDLNQTVIVKRNSVGNSAGSTDSLDYLSSLSSSSRDSNKMLNMAEVDAIVLQQEQSLQVHSTPKSSSKSTRKLFDNNISSVSLLSKDDSMSDSDRSSNDEYRTVRSNISSNDGLSETYLNTSATKSIESFTEKKEIKSTSVKNLNILGTKPLSNNRMPDIRGSYSNLKTAGTSLKGSYTNLKPIGSNFKSASVISIKDNKNSNLKTMGSSLKGSYTQLKPVLLNLPCTDGSSKYNPNSTVIKKPSSTILKSQSVVKVAEIPPRDLSAKDQVKIIPSSNAAKPQPKASGLPRLISSIPRPTSSRIPAPKSRVTNIRQVGRQPSKNNLDYDF